MVNVRVVMGFGGRKDSSRWYSVGSDSVIERHIITAIVVGDGDDVLLLSFFFFSLSGSSSGTLRVHIHLFFVSSRLSHHQHRTNQGSHRCEKRSRSPLPPKGLEGRGGGRSKMTFWSGEHHQRSIKFTPTIKWYYRSSHGRRRIEDGGLLLKQNPTARQVAGQGSQGTMTTGGDKEGANDLMTMAIHIVENMIVGQGG